MTETQVTMMSESLLASARGGEERHSEISSRPASNFRPESPYRLELIGSIIPKKSPSLGYLSPDCIWLLLLHLSTRSFWKSLVSQHPLFSMQILYPPFQHKFMQHSSDKTLISGGRWFDQDGDQLTHTVWVSCTK